VDFVKLRDRCSFKTACQSLGCWRGNATAEERTAIGRRRQERQWNLEREARQAETERGQRIQLRDELHTTARIYAELGTRLHELGPAGTEAEECWSGLSLALDDLRLTESSYCNVARIENPYEP
jgi:hypothetical protein